MDIVVNSEPNKNEAADNNVAEAPPASGQVIAPAPPEAAATPPTTASKPVMPPAAPGKKKGLLFVIIILLLLVAIGVGAYALLHKSKKPTQQATQTQKDIPQVIVGLVPDGSGAIFYPNAKNIDNSYDFNQQAFEGLVQFKNVNQIKPNLATSWTNPDDNTWDFKLAQNVKFHTGRTMTAADVKYSLENFKTTELGKIYDDTIKSVQVVNNNEVKVVTTSPDPLLLNKLAYLYIIDSQSKLKDSAENGTGPYTLKPGTTPNENSIQLVAFDQWHGGRPKTRAVTYKGFPDEASLTAAAAKGDVNATIVLFDAPDIATARASTKLKEIAAPNVGTSVILFNTNNPKFVVANTKVRQALYASLDLAALAKSRGVEVEVDNQLAPLTIPGYNPSIPPHVRDIAKAKQLLKDAGYPNGVTINFALFDQKGNGLPAEIVKETKEAGITFNIVLYQDSDKIEADIAAGKFDSWAYSVSTQLLDMSDIYTGYVKKWYSTPTITSLLNQSNKTIDATKRLAQLQQISKELSDNAGIIPLYVRLEHWYTDPSFVVTRDRGGEPFGANWATAYAK